MLIRVVLNEQDKQLIADALSAYGKELDDPSQANRLALQLIETGLLVSLDCVREAAKLTARLAALRSGEQIDHQWGLIRRSPSGNGFQFCPFGSIPWPEPPQEIPAEEFACHVLNRYLEGVASQG